MINESLLISPSMNEQLVLKISDLCIQYDKQYYLLPYLFLMFIMANMIERNLDIIIKYTNIKYGFFNAYRLVFRILQFIITVIMLFQIFLDMGWL